MSALPVWKCEFKAGQGEGFAPLDNLTVGSLFRMSCEGDIEVAWQQGPLQFTFPDKQGDYSLYFLKSENLAGKSVDLIVTGYRAGEFTPPYVRVVQGENGFETQNLKWAVKSVLKPNEKAEPYGPYGPWSVGWPLWFILGVAVILFAVILWIGRTSRRYQQRNKMLLELDRHKTALSPLHQYYRDARNLRRRLHNVKQTEELVEISRDLNREFRLYVLRQFKIPTLDWSDREIVRDFKKRHRKVYGKVREPLRKTLRELARLSAQNQILFKDVEQMSRMSLDTVEKIESARAVGGRR